MPQTPKWHRVESKFQTSVGYGNPGSANWNWASFIFLRPFCSSAWRVEINLQWQSGQTNSKTLNGAPNDCLNSKVSSIAVLSSLKKLHWTWNFPREINFLSPRSIWCNWKQIQVPGESAGDGGWSFSVPFVRILCGNLEAFVSLWHVSLLILQISTSEHLVYKLIRIFKWKGILHFSPITVELEPFVKLPFAVCTG